LCFHQYISCLVIFDQLYWDIMQHKHFAQKNFPISMFIIEPKKDCL
jgi:hypothetical protein